MLAERERASSAARVPTMTSGHFMLRPFRILQYFRLYYRIAYAAVLHEIEAATSDQKVTEIAGLIARKKWERPLVERVLLLSGPVEGSAVAMPPTVDAPETAVIGGRDTYRDLRIAGWSIVPGGAVTFVSALVNPGFVAHGWPLFAILSLGLFAGSIATFGPRART